LFCTAAGILMAARPWAIDRVRSPAASGTTEECRRLFRRRRLRGIDAAAAGGVAAGIHQEQFDTGKAPLDKGVRPLQRHQGLIPVTERDRF
jgi:hypothetical protein